MTSSRCLRRRPGGIVLLETLNMLEGFPMRDMSRSAPSLHVMIEAMKRAYADRARYLGDPAFVKAPIATLMRRTTRRQRAGHRPRHATPWPMRFPATRRRREGDNTTHFSIVAAAATAVSNTYTLNYSLWCLA